MSWLTNRIPFDTKDGRSWKIRSLLVQRVLRTVCQSRVVYPRGWRTRDIDLLPLNFFFRSSFPVWVFQWHLVSQSFMIRLWWPFHTVWRVSQSLNQKTSFPRVDRLPLSTSRKVRFFCRYVCRTIRHYWSKHTTLTPGLYPRHTHFPGLEAPEVPRPFSHLIDRQCYSVVVYNSSFYCTRLVKSLCPRYRYTSYLTFPPHLQWIAKLTPLYFQTLVRHYSFYFSTWNCLCLPSKEERCASNLRFNLWQRKGIQGFRRWYLVKSDKSDDGKLIPLIFKMVCLTGRGWKEESHL